MQVLEVCAFFHILCPRTGFPHFIACTESLVLSVMAMGTSGRYPYQQDTSAAATLQMCTLKALCPSPSASAWWVTRLRSTIPLAEVRRKLLIGHLHGLSTHLSPGMCCGKGRSLVLLCYNPRGEAQPSALLITLKSTDFITPYNSVSKIKASISRPS